MRGRLWLDALALAAVLVVVVIVAGPGPAYMSDEGNVFLQSEALLAGEWVVPYAFADVDPELEFRHLQRGLIVETGVVPYVRHPLHAVLVTPLFGAFGVAGFIGVGIGGVIATAWVSAALAGLVDRRWRRAVFWIVGLASPIAFHAHLWLAHSVAAAASGLAALLAVFALRRHWTWALGAGSAAAFAAALRSEGLFVGPALGAVVGALWLAKRVRFGPALVTSAALGLMPLAVWMGERAYSDAVFGSSSMTVQVESLSRSVGGSFNAFLITMLYSSYMESVVFWLLAASPVVLWHVGKRAQATGDSRPVVWVGSAVLGLLLVRLIQPDVWPIPGLWVAFPLGVLLISQLRRSDLTALQVALPAGGAVLIWLGILATQYSDGGGLEWGGRYFTVVIPLMAPALAVGLASAATWKDRAQLARLAAVITVVLLGIQIASLGAIHNSTERFVSDLEAAGSTVSDAPRGRPIAYAVDVETLSFMTTDAFDHFDWMIARELEKYDEGLAILDDVGAREVVLIAEPTVPDPPGWTLEAATQSAFNMEVRVYSR